MLYYTRLYYTRGMTAAAEARTDREPWCTQHRRPRSECHPPWDRHVWSSRISDELMRRVEAKAKGLRLDRNGGVEAALEAWAADAEASPAAPGKQARSEDGQPSAARTEPPAPAPVPRRGAKSKSTAKPPVVAADRDLAATVASLQARIDQMEAERRSPGTAVFMEPGSAPVVGYESPEVPDRSRRRSRPKCSHHVPAGTRCKICEPAR